MGSRRWYSCVDGVFGVEIILKKSRFQMSHGMSALLNTVLEQNLSVQTKSNLV